MEDEITCFSGPVIRRELSRPCHVYQDITFIERGNGHLSAADLVRLTFTNFYVYKLAIQQLNVSGSFVTILEEKLLMPDGPSFENGAQREYTISTSEFNQKYSSTGKSLRFLLYQPSSQWIKFELRNIKAFAVLSTSRKSDEDAITSTILMNNLVLSLRRLQLRTSSSSSSSESDPSTSLMSAQMDMDRKTLETANIMCNKNDGRASKRAASKKKAKSNKKVISLSKIPSDVDQVDDMFI